MTATAQVDAYLSTHSYGFSLDSGFDARTQDSLKVRLQGYRLVLQAEGGSHQLRFYTRLPLVWIGFLNRQMGLTHFFLEGGHGAHLLAGQYLRTGDTSYLHIRDKVFWKGLLAYDQNRPENRRVFPGGGVDFERVNACVPALSFLWKQKAPALLHYADSLLQRYEDTTRNCDTLLTLIKNLKEDFVRRPEDYKVGLGEYFLDYQDIIFNPGTCRDVYRNRNGHMAGRLLAFAARLGDPIYYGEFGEAHTLLNEKKTMGHLINTAPGWEGKVCAVNLYCYQCTSTEPVSNWPLHKIEPDILQHFLPLCKEDFTLFDVSGLPQYSAYGPLLIIARGQH
ncbi:hypothetical protein EDB95_4685 [Dinghuibacter silviterrae]|uniref:Uncharacterized protein n=2 Tax=Dinghuibacter silviterrae TaxID=1539049 RepID=A0A4R8DGP6_9BACT|nr:hypothetical protein EDB95_4685 [Dinghuibacter silviterrae]